MAWRSPRVKRPKESDVPKGYDSKFEHRLDTEVLDSEWVHIPTPDPNPIAYFIEHNYHTDFIRTIEDGDKVIYLEAKGRFWDFAEYNKYVWIGKALKPHEELVFLFADPHAPMPATKKRKDGTKYSHREWAERNNFRWFSESTLPKEWRK
jgi:hypothetical protein